MLAVGAIESMMYVLLATGDTAVVAGSTATALTVVVAFTRTTIGPTTPPVVAGVVPSVVTLISAVGSGDATTTDWGVVYAPAVTEKLTIGPVCNGAVQVGCGPGATWLSSKIEFSVSATGSRPSHIARARVWFGSRACCMSCESRPVNVAVKLMP